jgi:hypothetical protein
MPCAVVPVLFNFHQKKWLRYSQTLRCHPLFINATTKCHGTRLTDLARIRRLRKNGDDGYASLLPAVNTGLRQPPYFSGRERTDGP